MPPQKPVARGALLQTAAEESTVAWRQFEPGRWRLKSRPTARIAYTVFVESVSDGFQVLIKVADGDHMPQVVGHIAGADIEAARTAFAHGERAYVELEAQHG